MPEERLLFEGEIRTDLLANFFAIGKVLDAYSKPQGFQDLYMVVDESGWHVRQIDITHVIAAWQTLAPELWDSYIFTEKAEFVVNDFIALKVVGKLFMRKYKKGYPLTIRIYESQMVFTAGNTKVTVPLEEPPEELRLADYSDFVARDAWTLVFDRITFKEVGDAANREYIYIEAGEDEAYVYNGVKKYYPSDVYVERGNPSTVIAAINVNVWKTIVKIDAPYYYITVGTTENRDMPLYIRPDVPYECKIFTAPYLNVEQYAPPEIKEKTWRVVIGPDIISLYRGSISTIAPQYLAITDEGIVFQSYDEKVISVIPWRLVSEEENVEKFYGYRYKISDYKPITTSKQSVEIYASEDNKLYVEMTEIGAYQGAFDIDFNMLNRIIQDAESEGIVLSLPVKNVKELINKAIYMAVYCQSGMPTVTFHDRDGENIGTLTGEGTCETNVTRAVQLPETKYAISGTFVKIYASPELNTPVVIDVIKQARKRAPVSTFNLMRFILVAIGDEEELLEELGHEIVKHVKLEEEAKKKLEEEERERYERLEQELEQMRQWEASHCVRIRVLDKKPEGYEVAIRVDYGDARKAIGNVYAKRLDCIDTAKTGGWALQGEFIKSDKVYLITPQDLQARKWHIAVVRGVGSWKYPRSELCLSRIDEPLLEYAIKKQQIISEDEYVPANLIAVFDWSTEPERRNAIRQLANIVGECPERVLPPAEDFPYIYMVPAEPEEVERLPNFLRLPREFAEYGVSPYITGGTLLGVRAPLPREFYEIWHAITVKSPQKLTLETYAMLLDTSVPEIINQIAAADDVELARTIYLQLRRKKPEWLPSIEPLFNARQLIMKARERLGLPPPEFKPVPELSEVLAAIPRIYHAEEKPPEEVPEDVRRLIEISKQIEQETQKIPEIKYIRQLLDLKEKCKQWHEVLRTLKDSPQLSSEQKNVAAQLFSRSEMCMNTIDSIITGKIRRIIKTVISEEGVEIPEPEIEELIRTLKREVESERIIDAESYVESRARQWLDKKLAEEGFKELWGVEEDVEQAMTAAFEEVISSATIPAQLDILQSLIELSPLTKRTKEKLLEKVAARRREVEAAVPEVEAPPPEVDIEYLRSKVREDYSKAIAAQDYEKAQVLDYLYSVLSGALLVDYDKALMFAHALKVDKYPLADDLIKAIEMLKAKRRK